MLVSDLYRMTDPGGCNVGRKFLLDFRQWTLPEPILLRFAPCADAPIVINLNVNDTWRATDRAIFHVLLSRSR